MTSTSTTLNTPTNNTTSQPHESSIQLIKTREGAITKVSGDGLTGPNWVTWRIRMWFLLALCEVESYVRSEIQQPNHEEDPVGHDNRHLMLLGRTWKPSIRTRARRLPSRSSVTFGTLLLKKMTTLASTLPL